MHKHKLFIGLFQLLITQRILPTNWEMTLFDIFEYFWKISKNRKIKLIKFDEFCIFKLKDFNIIAFLWLIFEIN